METKVEKTGVGFLDLLAIVFIILKLCGVISWSWVWVLAPIWIQGILFIIIVLVLLLMGRRWR